MNKTLGIILIVLGLFGLAWGGFTYTTTEKVVDIGTIHATRDKTHNVPLPPIAVAVALIGCIYFHTPIKVEASEDMVDGSLHVTRVHRISAGKYIPPRRRLKSSCNLRRVRGLE